MPGSSTSRPAPRGQALRIRGDVLSRSSPARQSSQVTRCRRKFLRAFPDGFRDETYLAWERDYKWHAHLRWEQVLNRAAYRTLLKQGDYLGIATRAVAIEARTNLIFSFEKMALRDAVKSRVGAEAFARGLFDFLHGPGAVERK